MTPERVPQSEVDQGRRIVGISNTYMRGQEWFAHAQEGIMEVLAGVRRLVVLPYALGNMDWYTGKLEAAFKRMGVPEVMSPHTSPGDERKVIEDAEAIYIGGGNTPRLVANLHGLRHRDDGSLVDTRKDACQQPLVQAIRRKVADGVPMLGASAGLNVMCGDIRTTNDMHVAIQRLEDGALVSRVDALRLLPRDLNMNPHYLEKVAVTDEERAAAIAINGGLAQLIDHQGESRSDRLKRALEMAKERTIIALREGAYVVINGARMELQGTTGGLIFTHGNEPSEIEESDLSHLLTA